MEAIGVVVLVGECELYCIVILVKANGIVVLVGEGEWNYG